MSQISEFWLSWSLPSRQLMGDLNPPSLNHRRRPYQIWKGLLDLHMNRLPGKAPATQGSPCLRVLIPEPPLQMGRPQYISHIPRVKLPKLSLKSFNGDLAKWITHLLGHIQIDSARKPSTHEHRQIELFEFPLGSPQQQKPFPV